MHDFFAPDGTNVNFAAVQGANSLEVRTYERGVEDETMACGTGSVASAIILSLKGLVKGPVDVATRGGEILRVYHDVMDDGTITHVFLEGDTVVVYTGVLQELSV
jgi:diaminopimelate epimerase